MFAQGIHRWQLGFPQEVERPRQQHRDRTRGGHGDGVVFGHELQVVGGQRLVTRRQAGAVQRRQLLGVQFHRQTELLRGHEHFLDLRRGKRQVLAERIHRVHQAIGRQGREHFGANVLDVVVGAVLVLRRQGVGGEAGGAHADRKRFAETPGDPQHLAFVGQVEAVAGLDLDAGDTVAHQAFQALGGAGEQLIFAGRAGGAHGAGDAATAGGDLRVADTLQALFEFIAAVAAEHRVGVAVDQARGDPGAAEVVDLRIVIGRQLTTWADPLNERTGRHDGGILDDRVGALRHACDVAVLPEGFHPGPPWGYR